MSPVQAKLKFKGKKNIPARLAAKKVLSGGKENTCKTDLEEGSPELVVGLVDILENRIKCKSTEQWTPSSKRCHHSAINNSDKEDSSPSKRNSCATELTPSGLLDRLNLNASSVLKENVLPPKELFPSGNFFAEARRALHSAAPTTLPCREEMLAELRSLLLSHLADETPASLYVSGPPGTGKTACLSAIMADQQVSRGFKVVYINCTSMASSSAVYARIAEELGLKPGGHGEKLCRSAVEKYLASSHRMILLVLDEMDELDSRRQCVLYTVFDWVSLEQSRLVLVGVANALDLTDRVLPRLQARLSIRPTLIHFAPYSRQQIMDIISDRLTQAGVATVFPGSALQLLASKVAAMSGDVRKALDIARRVIEIAQVDNSSGKGNISVGEVMRVVGNVYATSQSLGGPAESEDSGGGESESFPLQQKLLICSLLLIRLKGRSKDVIVGTLHDVYKRVCAKRNLSSLDLSEFLSLTKLVQARGVLRIQGRTHNRLSKVSLQWDEKEIAEALQDKQLLSTILNDMSCLGP